MKIRQHFTLFSQWKSNNASPQVHHSTQNAILTTNKVPHFHDDNPTEFFIWCANRVSRLCIRHISTYSYRDEPKPFKVSSVLICVAYMGKLVSLGEMDWDNHTAMIMHIIQYEYAPMAIALSTYPHYKVKSYHDQRGSLMQS